MIICGYYHNMSVASYILLLLQRHILRYSITVPVSGCKHLMGTEERTKSVYFHLTQTDIKSC